MTFHLATAVSVGRHFPSRRARGGGGLHKQHDHMFRRRYFALCAASVEGMVPVCMHMLTILKIHQKLQKGVKGYKFMTNGIALISLNQIWEEEQ